VDVWCIIEGYHTKVTRERGMMAYFFREQYALTYNMNIRDETTRPIFGEEVYPLPGDKPIKSKLPSEELIAKAREAAKRMNQQKDGN
jgi:hypothetical protein